MATNFSSRMMAGVLDLVGVNLAGGSFGDVGTSNIVGKSHTYPTHATIDYFASKGMDVIRLDLKWERIQNGLNGSLNEGDLKFVDDTVSYAASKGVAVEVQLHNYGKFNNDLIGSAAVPTSAFADVWSKLAARYADDPNVLFGLMNEPHVHSAAQWLPIANAGIAAIRGAGATQEILVPGTYWDGAHSWVSSDNDTVIGGGVKDPLNNFAFEVHQYLDGDSSGTQFGVVSENIGADRLKAITQWAEATGNKLFLGEFGVATDPTSLKALEKMLAYMEEHGNVWQGGTYWAAGEWWGDYPFAIQPINGQDRPQLDVLENFTSPQAVPYWQTSGGTQAPAGPAPAPAPAPTPTPIAAPIPAPTPTTPAAGATVGGGSDVLVLRVSEDAYKGDATFTVTVDGKQVGGTLTAHASHRLGQSELFEVRGDWSAGSHKVGVNFLNDTYDGTPTTDRNLYLDGATVNGTPVSGAGLSLMASGAQFFDFTKAGTATAAPAPTPAPAPAPTPTTPAAGAAVGSGRDVLVLRVSEDAYKGDAMFTVTVDGKQVGGTLTAHASHRLGQSELFEVRGDWSAGSHKVGVTFLNDTYDGTAAADRNLYLDGATLNGAAVSGADLDFMSAGSQMFNFTKPASADALF